jgi:hypothetical protein
MHIAHAATDCNLGVVPPNIYDRKSRAGREIEIWIDMYLRTKLAQLI